MTIKYNQEFTDHRNTKNQSEMYQRRKSKQPVDITLDELKMSHDNHLYDQQIEMIKEELKEFINERIVMKAVIYVVIFWLMLGTLIGVVGLAI